VAKAFNRKEWTDKEVEFLKLNFRKFTAKELAQKLKRSLGSVTCALIALSLRKSKSYEEILPQTKFSKLTVIKKVTKRINGSTIYLCKCDCGDSVKCRAIDLINGHTATCGCRSNTLKSGQITINNIYRTYKNNAKMAPIPFNLSKNQFFLIATKDCHYCGSSPTKKNTYMKEDGTASYSGRRISKKTIENSWILLNGIDRMDSSKGYFEDNCVPCCTTCNIAKNALPYETFINWVKSVYNYLILKEKSKAISKRKGGSFGTTRKY